MSMSVSIMQQRAYSKEQSRTHESSMTMAENQKRAPPSVPTRMQTTKKPVRDGRSKKSLDFGDVELDTFHVKIKKCSSAPATSDQNDLLSSVCDDGSNGNESSSADQESTTRSQMVGPQHKRLHMTVGPTQGLTNLDLAPIAVSSVPALTAVTPSAPKLTLSAFRKPEFAIRLTSSPPTSLIQHDYDLSASRVLGHGASSTVRLAKHRYTGRKVAVKCIGKHDILRSYSHGKKRKKKLDECEILLSLKDSHESIINLLDVYETENEVQLVMEYCAGGELFDAIQRKRVRSSNKNNQRVQVDSSIPATIQQEAKMTGRKRTRSFTQIAESAEVKPSPAGYSEAQAAKIARQILSALSHMHERGIVHRDVKPENILLVSDKEGDDELTVKLSDFGLARVLQSQTDCWSSSLDEAPGEASPLTPPSARRFRAYSRVGSDYYAAPEVEMGNGYDSSADIYSFGVTLYILLSGFPPAARPRCGSIVLDDDSSSSEEEESEDESEVGQRFSKQTSTVEFPISQWRNISSSAKNLIRKMLRYDPEERLTAAEALQHEWIQFHTKTETKQLFTPSFTSPTQTRLGTSSVCSNTLLSLSTVKLNFLSASLFDSKKAKTQKRETIIKNQPKKRRFEQSSSNQATLDPDWNLRIPSPQNIVSASAMVDLYTHVGNVAAAATAAAAGILNENDDLVQLENGLEIKGVEGEAR